ncbi:MAG: aminotransferase class IV [Acidobacteriota bacterium]
MTRPHTIWMEGPSVSSSRACLPVSDRGVLYGEGLFETILVRAGRAFCLRAHLGRMAASAQALGLPLPEPGWEKRVCRALGKMAADLGDRWGRARLTLTAGDGEPGGDPAAPPTGPARLFLRVSPVSLPASGVWGRAVTAVVSGPRRAGTAEDLACHKTLSYLGNLLCLRQARRLGADEGLVQGAAGQVVSGARANLFVVQDGRLRTPDKGCLPGITRALVRHEIAPTLSIPLEKTSLGEADLWTAQEVFLTNSLVGILPVGRIGRRPRDGRRVGPITSRIIRCYRDILAQAGRWE